MQVDSLHHKVAIPQVQTAARIEIPQDTIITDSTVSYRLADLYPKDRFRKTYRIVQNNFVSASRPPNKPSIPAISKTLYTGSSRLRSCHFWAPTRELSGNIVNDYSINLIAGYSLGTAEIRK